MRRGSNRHETDHVRCRCRTHDLLCRGAWDSCQPGTDGETRTGPFAHGRTPFVTARTRLGLRRLYSAAPALSIRRDDWSCRGDLAAGDIYRVDLTCVADVGERIGVQDDQVRPLPHLESADPVDLHHACGST